jgi:peptidylprolyl isomerase
LVGAALGLTGPGWAGIASAAAHASAVRSHDRSGSSSARRPGPELPVIGYAKDLSHEPVVHPTKGRPPTKLEVRTLVVGKGRVAKSSSTVSVLYVGADYKTGKDFTQATWSHKPPTPTTFPLSGVVPGFAEGLVGMKVGGRREIVIPPQLGYGDRKVGPIAANETLVFVVDLKAVKA